MNFDLPLELLSHLESLDSFIESTLLPLQHANDNIRFFDHRREYARADWTRGGLPLKEWRDLLDQARILADNAGFYRFALPRVYGGQGYPDANLWMSAFRFHLASHPAYGGGLSLANDLQSEHSVLGNFPDVSMIHRFGTAEQRQTLIPQRLRNEFRATVVLTEPEHGSDATFLSTTATRVGNEFEITGRKTWQTSAHRCTHLIVFARTSRRPGSADGITAFLVPRDTPGVRVSGFEWTPNIPSDHATVELDNVRVPSSAVLGEVDHGLAIAQTFLSEHRIRQAAGSCGAAKYCLDRSIERVRCRKTPEGRALADHQAIQARVVQLMAQVEMLRWLILKTSWDMDRIAATSEADDAVPSWVEIERRLSDTIAMCNCWANRLCCQAADCAIQIHEDDGYSRHYPFEHIYRHFRRYRIPEGAEEIQMRKIAMYLFSFKEQEKGKREQQGRL